MANFFDVRLKVRGFFTCIYGGEGGRFIYYGAFEAIILTSTLESGEVVKGFQAYRAFLVLPLLMVFFILLFLWMIFLE